MTGIDRLRTLAEERDEWILGETLADVADQIERERECDADTIENLRLELGEARDEAAWVREHGGLEKIIQQRRGSVPRASFERKLGKRLRHIAECEEALRRRNATISALEKAADSLRKQIAEMLPRLMPEGMEWLVESWPRFEDGKPVRIGDVVSDVEVRSVVFRDGGILLSDCTSVPGWGTWRSYKEPIKRPSKVLDADGVDTSVGDTVYDVDTGEKMWVCALPEQGAYQCVKLRLINGMFKTLDPCRLTHRAPVIAADGRPLREGETVWDTNGDELIIGAFEDGGHTVTCRYADVGDAIPVHGMWSPSDLTHERPDSWERLEEDAGKNPCGYFGFDGEETCGKCPASGKNCEQTMARDIVRRAKELAERDAK